MRHSVIRPFDIFVLCCCLQLNGHTRNERKKIYIMIMLIRCQKVKSRSRFPNYRFRFAKKEIISCVHSFFFFVIEFTYCLLFHAVFPSLCASVDRSIWLVRQVSLIKTVLTSINKTGKENNSIHSRSFICLIKINFNLFRMFCHAKRSIQNGEIDYNFQTTLKTKIIMVALI